MFFFSEAFSPEVMSTYEESSSIASLRDFGVISSTPRIVETVSQISSASGLMSVSSYSVSES